MPTTSNFGWTTPADTDLVKDGAAAIRTLGNGIDTSLVDLKGGTTGQILSKNSNTDLDYTWINNDQGDITEVQAGTGISVASGTGPVPVVTNTVATTFDAKGDLVVGTGADTFAKLTVGTNDYVLTAASGETTGLKWAAVPSPSYTWTSFTPTFTNLTLGNGTTTGSYLTIGDLVFVEYRLKWGSTTSASGNFRCNNLPVNGKVTSEQALEGDTDTFQYSTTSGAYDSSASLYFSIQPSLNATAIANHHWGELSAGGKVLFVGNTSATAPFTWATSDVLYVRFSYRKA